MIDTAVRYIGTGDFRTTDQIQANVQQVLQTNRLSYGPFSRLFERDFAARHQCRFGVLSNSGTSSLHVALQTLKEVHGWHDGDEVIVPAATFVATVNIVLHNGLKPVLCDVEDGMWAMDINKVEDCLGPLTRCVLPVHPFGQPADMGNLFWLTGLKGLWLIEDACECVGATHRNIPVGNWSDIACFSFYVAHIIVSGVGGMALTNHSSYALKMRSLVNHGRDNIYIAIDDDDDLYPDRLHEVIGKRFRFHSVGHSFRITELEAALALPQLYDLENILAKRRENARFLLDYLSAYDDRLQLLSERPQTTNAWMMFPIVCVRDEKQGLCEFLEERGIETRDTLPLTCQPVYRDLFDPDVYPVAKKLNQRGFYIGCHQHLSEEDLGYVCETFREYFEAHP